jgi:hypothetical protein
MINSEIRPPVRVRANVAQADRRRTTLAGTAFTLSLLFSAVLISGLLG